MFILQSSGSLLTTSTLLASSTNFTAQQLTKKLYTDLQGPIGPTAYKQTNERIQDFFTGNPPEAETELLQRIRTLTDPINPINSGWHTEISRDLLSALNTNAFAHFALAPSSSTALNSLLLFLDNILPTLRDDFQNGVQGSVVGTTEPVATATPEAAPSFRTSEHAQAHGIQTDAINRVAARLFGEPIRLKSTEALEEKLGAALGKLISIEQNSLEISQALLTLAKISYESAYSQSPAVALHLSTRMALLVTSQRCLSKLLEQAPDTYSLERAKDMGYLAEKLSQITLQNNTPHRHRDIIAIAKIAGESIKPVDQRIVQTLKQINKKVARIPAKNMQTTTHINPFSFAWWRSLFSRGVL